ncbi:MAG: hypothetical protein JWP06_246 [Candidatus Saccharibacteria bacterium]|nr:hypothetical protein [Candidatus Saccharibacteria bacterium]
MIVHVRIYKREDFMTRLPQPGADENTWGGLLNEYLTVSHDADGSIKANAIDASAVQPNSISGVKLQDDSVTDAKLAAGSGIDGHILTKDSLATGGFTWSPPPTGATPATAITLGTIQLAGDIGGTATAPTVPGLASKQPLDSDLTAIAVLTPTNDDFIQRKAGSWTSRTPAQVKTDLALTKADVALGNIDNTSDSAKPVSTAQQAAIDLKESTANKGIASGYANLDSNVHVPVGQLGSGTATTATYLRGDGAWTTAPVTSVAGRGGAVTLAESDITNLTTDLAGRTTVSNGGGETYFDAGNSGAAITLNLVNGNVQKLTLTSNCTITLTSPASGAYRSCLIYLFQDSTGLRTVTWPASVRWGAAGIPVLSTAASKMDKILLDTVDGGATWFGAPGPGGY